MFAIGDIDIFIPSQKVVMVRFLRMELFFIQTVWIHEEIMLRDCLLF